MKIRYLKSIVYADGRAYKRGNVAEIGDVAGQRLILAGIAEPIPMKERAVRKQRYERAVSE